MPMTDDELDKRTREIEKLRRQVEDEESKRNSILRGSHNDIVMATLDTEEERLNRRLEMAKDATKVAKESVKRSIKAAKGGSAGPESDSTDNPTPDGEAVTPTGEAPKNNKE